MRKELKGIFEKIEIVRAIETLEYHNKIFLGYDAPRNTREIIDLLTECLNELSDLN